MEQETKNIHAQEAPQEQECNFSSTSTGGPKSPKLRCIRRQAPHEDLEKLSKHRPKVSLTPAEIEEDLKFFAQKMDSTNTSDTRQKKMRSVSEAAFIPKLNEVPEVPAKPPKFIYLQQHSVATVTKKD